MHTLRKGPITSTRRGRKTSFAPAINPEEDPEPQTSRLPAPQLLAAQLIALRAEPCAVHRERFQHGNAAVFAALFLVQSGVEAEDHQVVRQPTRPQCVVPQYRFLLEAQPLEELQARRFDRGSCGR